MKSSFWRTEMAGRDDFTELPAWEVDGRQTVAESGTWTFSPADLFAEIRFDTYFPENLSWA
jgi:hypothetical protein